MSVHATRRDTELIACIKQFAEEMGRQPTRSELMEAFRADRKSIISQIRLMRRRGLAVLDRSSPWGARLTEAGQAAEFSEPERLSEEQKQLAAEWHDYAMRIASNYIRVSKTHRAEIRSAAQLGLCEAASRFDPGRGIKFKTFAGQRISGAIKDELRLLSERPRFAKKDKFYPSTVSLHSPTGKESDGGRPQTPLDVLEDYMTTSGEDVRDIDHLDQMDKFAETIPDRGGVILRLFYGERERTMRQLGQILGCSQSRVSQIHTRTIKDIRERPEAYGFDRPSGEQPKALTLATK